jgi:hypothetical protein
VARDEDDLLTTATLGEASLKSEAIESRQIDIKHKTRSARVLSAPQKLVGAAKSLDWVIG